MNDVNPAKDRLVCLTCEATAVDDSKHRGRFKRRHFRDNVCGNYQIRLEEGRKKLAADLLAQRIKEEAKNGGTQVDMSGDGNTAPAVDGPVLQEDSK